MINIREQIANVHVLYKNLFTEVHTISMHFRLGDYLLNPQFHIIMPYEYYERALKHIISVNPDIQQKQIQLHTNRRVQRLNNTNQTTHPKSKHPSK